jgi:MscS family membrane protein
MEENFKTTRNEWQDPKIWISDFSASDRTYNVKFYIDDVTLEYYQRGKRIQSEINQELTWQLRRAYLAG